MSDDLLNNEILTLERKIRLLLNEHSRLKEDLNTFRSENTELRKKLEDQQSEMDTFQNRIKISKIVENMRAGEEGNSKELKEVLDQYIKEIDKCINHLSEA